MSIPEPASALEAFRLQLINDLNMRFEQFVSALDPDFIATLAFAKLSAPVGENYTSAASWRRHIQILHSALVKEFGRREFRVKELRAFLESRVELLPGDRKLRPGHAVGQGLVWHKSVYDAIACRPCTWGDSGALIVYVSRDRWRVWHAVP